MNYTTAIFLLNPNVRAVMCNYEPDAPDKKVMFKTLDPTIKVGDFVIVPTRTRHGMTVSKVVEVDVDVDFDNPTLLDWLVERIDRATHNATVAQEAEAIAVIKSAERTRKRDELARALHADSNGALKALSITIVSDTDPLSVNKKW
jgi:hypothetical protein